MTEKEWLESNEPHRMIEFLKGKVTDRKLRLLGSSCCRLILTLLKNPKGEEAITLAERVADGEADPKELWDALTVLQDMVKAYPPAGMVYQGTMGLVMATGVTDCSIFNLGLHSLVFTPLPMP